MTDERSVTRTRTSSEETATGGKYVYEVLVDAGVECLIGIPGTQTLPLDRIVATSEAVDYVMARHETAIPHIAWGYYESSGEVAATLTVPGPGDTNVMHGLKNALNDCVPIVHISADVDPENRGKSPIHEISASTFDTVVKENLNVRRPIELPGKVAQAFEIARSPPYGPVRLGIPSGILESETDLPEATFSPPETAYDNTEKYEQIVEKLAQACRPVVYAGGGTRRSPDGQAVLRELIEALDAPVITSYKGKGVFPEDDPHFMGVTGSSLPAGAIHVLERADVVLALGTNFDGVTTDHWTVPMGDSVVHVNLDADVFDASYDADVAIVEDVAVAGRHILSGVRDGSNHSRWDGQRIAASVREEYDEILADQDLLDDTTPLRTPRVLRTVRDAIPRDAIVTVDVGGFRLWAMQAFEVYEPKDYIAAGSWAGMGVGLPAAIGAQLANPKRTVVSLTGDGGLMMCIHELHTAVEYGLDITVVVSNNNDYGVISKSPKIREYSDGHQFEWSSPDFVDIAEGFGCQALRVESDAELHDAVTSAVEQNTEVPTLIDVAVHTDEPSASAAAEFATSLDLTADD